MDRKPKVIYIQSFSDPDTFYKVIKDRRGEWQCSCPHNVIRRVPCKHIPEAKERIKNLPSIMEGEIRELRKAFSLS